MNASAAVKESHGLLKNSETAFLGSRYKRFAIRMKPTCLIPFVIPCRETATNQRETLLNTSVSHLRHTAPHPNPKR